MSSTQNLPILIIGAGLSGLTIARLLSHHFIPYAIFGSSPRTACQGYGMTARAWAYEALLKELDISITEFKSKVATDCAVGGNGKVDRMLYDLATAKPLMPVPREKTGAGGPLGDLFRANRNLLREFLMEGVDVGFEYELVDVEVHQEGHGKYAVAKFKNGEMVTGSLVVGADGIHSFVRRRLLPHVEPFLNDVVVFSGERTMSSAGFDDQLGDFVNGTSARIGLADNAMLTFTVVEKKPNQVDLWWMYLDRLGAMSPPFQRFFQKEKITNDRLYRWNIRTIVISMNDLEHLASMGVTLVGDAAHAMTIFRGGGGNHAMADGVELLNSLKGGASANALGEFVRKARPRWQMGIGASEKDMHIMHQTMDA